MEQTLLFGKRKCGLHLVSISRSSSTPHHASSSVRVSSSQWHRGLSHPTLEFVSSILK